MIDDTAGLPDTKACIPPCDDDTQNEHVPSDLDDSSATLEMGAPCDPQKSGMSNDELDDI